jgi:hypothetical protein
MAVLLPRPEAWNVDSMRPDRRLVVIKLPYEWIVFWDYTASL